MKRALWAMPDNEVYELKCKAEALLRELNLEHVNWIGYAQQQESRLAVVKENSKLHDKISRTVANAWRRIDQIEQRIAAQRQYVQALCNEHAHRNPPFWTRQDLEDMERGPHRR